MALKRHYKLESLHYSPSWARRFKGISVNSPALKVWGWILASAKPLALSMVWLITLFYGSGEPQLPTLLDRYCTNVEQKKLLSHHLLNPSAPSKPCSKPVKLQAAWLKAEELFICSEVLKSFAVMRFSTVAACGGAELLPLLQKASFVWDSTQNHVQLCEAITAVSFCPASPFCLCFQHSCNQLPDLQAEGRPWGQSRIVLDSNLIF